MWGGVSGGSMVKMETSGGSNRSYSYPVLKDDSWFSQFRNGSNPWMARYVYALIFLAANLLAWAVRDYGGSAYKDLQRLKSCKGEGCLGAEGVLRVSLGCFVSFRIIIHENHRIVLSSLIKFLRVDYRFFWFCCPFMQVQAFYSVMFLTTAGTSKMYECRSFWQSGWWSAKIGLWVSLTAISFLLPSPLIQIYGEVAHFGAGIFLLVQLVSVISFITWLNDCCQSEKIEGRCHVYVMFISTTSYVVCIVGIILMYLWYAPDSSCLLNIFFITWTLVLLQLMTSVSLHPRINRGFLTPGLMGLYVVFICWCAIRSEPAGQHCNRKAENSSRTDWLTIISFVIALLAMVIATFSTGIDSQCFQIRKKEPPAQDAVPYAYGFFHFVFATGAMYFAMLLIGWNTHHAIRKWTIDVGWTSAWVRIVNEWLAVCIYIWMLVAPIILQTREANLPV